MALAILLDAHPPLFKGQHHEHPFTNCPAKHLHPTTLQIPAKLLLCIREFAARSDVRYHLNTLHFSTRAGRAYISATDGHMGGIIRSDEGAVQGPDINWLFIKLFDKLSKSHLTITFSPPMLCGQVLSAMPEAEEADVSMMARPTSPHPGAAK